MTEARTEMLAIDWGTTSARAYRLGSSGRILDERSAPLGIQRVANGAFAEALTALLGDWQSLDVPRVACGMIGSRQGWIEAPYRACPVPIRELGSGMTSTPGGELAIVSGITCRDAAGVPDVVRGEETQIAGLVEDADTPTLVIQPGTHSKWTVAGPLAGGDIGIRSFATFMTGETFAVLSVHSILGRLMQPAQELDRTSFMRGVTRALAATSSGELLHDVFGARTLALFGELPATGVGDYLSGILIGAEMVAGRQWAAAQGVRTDAVTLAGSVELCERYRIALESAGVAARAAAPEVAARGLWRLALAAGLIQGH